MPARRSLPMLFTCATQSQPPSVLTSVAGLSRSATRWPGWKTQTEVRSPLAQAGRSAQHTCVRSGSTIKWPRQSHPRAVTPAGRERTPWVTSWARATFEQGILSVLPMLTGPCTVASQASALPRNRMRPAIFHAFGKAKVGAQAALRELEQQGWETLPIAILGLPNLPSAWVVET